MIAVVSVSLFIVCFVSGPFNYELPVHRNCCICYVNLFIKSVSDYYSVDFLLGCLPYSIHLHYTSWSSISFQLADLLSLFTLLPCFDAGSPVGV